MIRIFLVDMLAEIVNSIRLLKLKIINNLTIIFSKTIVQVPLLLGFII